MSILYVPKASSFAYTFLPVALSNIFMYGFLTSLASSSCIVTRAFKLIESTSKLSTLNTGDTNSGKSSTTSSIIPPEPPFCPSPTFPS